MLKILAVSTAVFLSACATIPADAPAYSRAPDAPEGQANVYIYRVGAVPFLRTPTIKINDEAIFDLPECSYTVVTLPAGTHEFMVDWSFDAGAPDLKFPFEVAAGTPVYIKITGSFGAGYRSMTFGSAAKGISRAAAEAELQVCCQYIKPIVGNLNAK